MHKTNCNPMTRTSMTSWAGRAAAACLAFLSVLMMPAVLKAQDRFPWPEGKKFAISLSFDDSRESNLELGIPLLDRHGVRATFYAHPKNVRARLDEWKAAVANGHEVANHTMTHPCSENFLWGARKSLEHYTLADMKAELVETSRQLEALLGVAPTTFAYPCGQTFGGRGEGKQSYAPLIAELFTSGRGWLDEAPADPLFCDLAEVSGMKMDDIDFEELLPVIEYARANNLWLVLVGHDTQAERGPQVTNLAFLEELCAYISAHEDVGAAPLAEVSAHIQTTRTNGRLLPGEPLPVWENSSGEVNLRAELGKGVGPTIEYMPDWKAYGWWTAKDSVVWNLELDTPGIFRAVLEWSISDEEAGKEVEFHVAGQVIRKAIPSSGSWETFRFLDLGEVELPAGLHRMVVKPANPNEEGHFMDLRNIQLKRKTLPANADVGVALYSFNRFGLHDALRKANAAGVEYVEGFSFHSLGGAFGSKTIAQLDDREIVLFRNLLAENSLRMVSMYGDGQTVAEWEQLFANASRLGMAFIVGEPAPTLWDELNEVAGQYGMKLAIHQHAEGLSRFWHPDSVLAALEGRENFAACGDVGHWVRSGLDPVECLNTLRGRLVSVHLKDLDTFGNLDAADVRLGDGVIDYEAVVRALRLQGFDGYAFVECEHDWEDNLGDVSDAVVRLRTWLH